MATVAEVAGYIRCEKCLIYHHSKEAHDDLYHNPNRPPPTHWAEGIRDEDLGHVSAYAMARMPRRQQ